MHLTWQAVDHIAAAFCVDGVGVSLAGPGQPCRVVVEQGMTARQTKKSSGTGHGGRGSG